MRCGREPGGASVAELGVCAAATEARCDGINDGDNAGRACWLVVGTLCGGEVNGTFAHKLGGKIAVESRCNVGTNFTVTLPVEA